MLHMDINLDTMLFILSVCVYASLSFFLSMCVYNTIKCVVLVVTTAANYNCVVVAIFSFLTDDRIFL